MATFLIALHKTLKRSLPLIFECPEGILKGFRSIRQGVDGAPKDPSQCGDGLPQNRKGMSKNTSPNKVSEGMRNWRVRHQHINSGRS
jgi:hypothetical protein